MSISHITYSVIYKNGDSFERSMFLDADDKISSVCIARCKQGSSRVVQGEYYKWSDGIEEQAFGFKDSTRLFTRQNLLKKNHYTILSYIRFKILCLIMKIEKKLYQSI